MLLNVISWPGSSLAGNAELYKQLNRLGDAYQYVHSEYYKDTDMGELVDGAIARMLSVSNSTSPCNLRLAPGETYDNEEARLYGNLNRLGDAFDAIRARCSGAPDAAKLVNAAIEGMLARLDPHSGYIDAKTLNDATVNPRNEGVGLGMDLTKRDGVLTVVSAIDGTPAHGAGLQPGDRITHVDRKPVAGASLAEVVDRLRGPVGSTVVLTIERDRESAPQNFNLVRDTLRITSVRFSNEGDVGYIRIASFGEQTDAGVKRAIEALEQKIGREIKGFVLDLRNNPGGLLNQAISVADLFLDGGEVMTVRGRGGEVSQRHEAAAGDLTGGKPLVVLINKGSAAAAEIVAGALQHNRRATVLGTRSFGRGTLQQYFPLAQEGALLLTTGSYYTPAGRQILGAGIEPDVIVASSAPAGANEDRVLQAALETLRAGSVEIANRDRKQSAPERQVVRADSPPSADPIGDSRGALAVQFQDGEAPVTLYERSHALVIGIDDYAVDWPRLSNAVDDARAVAAALERRGFNVSLVTNPDSSELENSIERFVFEKGADSGARLFIWFAGHGHTLNGEGYLVPSGAPGPGAGWQFRQAALSLRRFGEYMREIQSKHVLAVFDSCFAGTVFDTARSKPSPAIDLATTQPVRQFISSGDAEQTVSDDGTFRKLFVDALNGLERNADANRDGYITGSELGLFLGDKVTVLSGGRQTPRYGKLSALALDRGDFVFAVGERELNPETVVQEPVSETHVGGEQETVFWTSIRDSEDTADFEEYLRLFPKGVFTGLAKHRIERLKNK